MPVSIATATRMSGMTEYKIDTKSLRNPVTIVDTVEVLIQLEL